MSKGSNQRPSKVPKKQYEENWDKIFGKKKNEKPKKTDKNGNRIFGNPNCNL